DVFSERAAEPVLDEVGRSELKDQRAELVERLARDLLELSELAARGVCVAVEQRCDGLRRQDDAVELLADDVVEIERESVALGDHRELAALLQQARVREGDRRV